MTRSLPHATFLVGLAVLGWIGLTYSTAQPIALLVTLVIAGFYVAGAVELQRFRAATHTLHQALSRLDQTPGSLDSWLSGLHASLRNAVRIRIEEERVPLPAPSLSPYLTGLLVLLGMLGTFLGLVVTLKGTGAAMEAAANAETIRASLATPVKGLSLAFGTSVAGVAASAALGLMTALSRRERAQATQLLDAAIENFLHPYSLVRHRRDSAQLLREQSHAMPAIVARLDDLITRLMERSESLNEKLLSGHAQLQLSSERSMTALAGSVELALDATVQKAAQATRDAMLPAVTEAMTRIELLARSLHEEASRSVQGHLVTSEQRLDSLISRMAAAWQEAASEQRATHSELVSELNHVLTAFSRQMGTEGASLLHKFEAQQSAAQDSWALRLEALSRQSVQLQERLGEVANTQVAQLGQRLAAQQGQQMDAWVRALDQAAAVLRQASAEAGEQSMDRQQRLCEVFEQGIARITRDAERDVKTILAHISELAEASAEAPRAAARMSEDLRERFSESLVHDRRMVEERSRLLEQMASLIQKLDDRASEQKAASEVLLASAQALLEQSASTFQQSVTLESSRLQQATAGMTHSAIEVASLSDAFGHAVDLFAQSNEKLTSQMQRIESALSKAAQRNDEQLAYYVAQAREIVDLSLMSQQQIMKDLRAAAAPGSTVASAAWPEAGG